MEIEHMEMVYIYQYHKRWLEYIDLSHGNVGHGVFSPWSMEMDMDIKTAEDMEMVY